MCTKQHDDFQHVLAQRANYLSKSLDKLQNRDENCQISNTDDFLSKSTLGIKRTLANAFLDQYSSLHSSRERRQVNQSETLHI